MSAPETLLVLYGQHTERVAALAWSPDGTRIASASWDKTVHIWEATTGKTPHKYRFLRKKKEKAGQAQPCYADENIFPISSAAGGREWLAHSDYQRGSRRCQARLPT